MSLDQFSVVLCRGIGLALLLFGSSSLLPALVALLFGPTTDVMMGVRVTWTRYTPPEFTFRQLLFIALRANLAPLAQVVLGVVLLVFSRSIGSLLAAGLFDRAA